MLGVVVVHGLQLDFKLYGLLWSVAIGADEFLIRDGANEKKFQFNLASSLKLAAKKPMLEGYKIHVTSSVKPEPNQMKGNQFQVTFHSCFESFVRYEIKAAVTIAIRVRFVSRKLSHVRIERSTRKMNVLIFCLYVRNEIERESSSSRSCDRRLMLR